LEGRKNRLMEQYRKALCYAFPKTIPVLAGYLVLGAAYGVLMEVNGFGLMWAAAMSLFVYAGSLQYAGIPLLAAGVHPGYALMMALMINARHLFYGISMLEKYRDLGRGKGYLIFSLTDETFSVLCREDPPKGLPKKAVYLCVSLLNHLYWLVGTVLGVLAGSLFTFDTRGLDFVLTALFAAIATDQWGAQPDHRPALVGIGGTLVCLLLFGRDIFLIPSMAVIFLAVFFFYRWDRRKGEVGS
jgi:4-azaleucine resistance transporter AzlC